MALIIVFLIFMVVGQTLGLVLTEAIYHLDFTEISDMVNRPERYAIGANRFFLISSSLIQFIGCAYFFSWLVSEKDFLKIRTVVVALSIPVACLTILACIPLVSYLAEVNNLIRLPAGLRNLEAWMQASEARIDHLEKFLMATHGPSDLAVNLIMIALIPAIGEELLFRGCFQQLMIRTFRSPHIGILAAAVLFSALHLQFYGFFPRVFLGLLLGYLYYWSRSIWLSMAAHFFNNALAVLSASVSVMNTKFLNTDTAQSFTWPWVFLSALVVSLGMLSIFRAYKLKGTH